MRATCLAVTLLASTILTAAPALAQRGHDRILDDSPVVRAARGDVGMFFAFSGLATMGIGSTDASVGTLLIQGVGIKWALTDRWMLPVTFGAGLRIHDPSGPIDSQNDWGLVAGIGFEYHFRVWRRISPYVGAGVELGFNDPSGPSNFRFATSLGPTLGVEFFWGDRVSLAAHYDMRIRVTWAEDAFTELSMATQAGGGLTLTFYF